MEFWGKGMGFHSLFKEGINLDINKAKGITHNFY